MIPKPAPFHAETSNTVSTPPLPASINTLTIQGVLITKDIAKQLDELHFEDRGRFEPYGRIRSGIDHGNPGIELIGTDTATGALVRMFHITKLILTPRLEDHKFLPPRTDVLADERDALANAYRRIPLIVLPKDGRP